MCWIPSTIIPENPFDHRDDQRVEIYDDLLSMMHIDGSDGFQAKLRELCREFIDVFRREFGANPLRWRP